MIDHNLSKGRKYFLAAGHSYFWVMIVLAVVFAEDRFCRDPSYYLMRIINERAFIVEHYRFTTVITQVLAVLGVWLQLPLRWIIILYSVNDYLFYYAVFLLLAYRFKSEKYLFAWLLCLCIGTDYLFFLPGLILIVGVAFMMLFFAFLERADLNDRKHWALVLLLQALTLYSYPTLFIPLLFLLVILYLLKNISSRTLLFLSLVTIVIIGLKGLLKDPYDSGIINFITSRQHLEIVQSEINTLWVRSFVREYLGIYWPLIILFISAITTCMINRKLLQFFAPLTFIALVFIFLVYSNTYHLHDAYFERLQYLLVPTVAGWAILVIYPNRKAVFFIKPVIILLLVYNIYNVVEARPYYHERVEKINRIIEAAKQTGARKFTLMTYSTPIGSDIDDWSLPIKSMLYSSLASPDSSMTIFRNSDSRLLVEDMPLTLIRPDKFIFRLGDVYPINYLNRNYFRLKPGYYIPLNGERIYDTTRDYYNFMALEIPKTLKLSASTFNKVRIGIADVDPKETINSLAAIQLIHTGRLYFSYQFFDQNKKLMPGDEYKTPLDIDVKKSYSQIMYVHAPSQKGNYILKIELATDEGKLKGVSAETNCTLQ